MLRKDEQRQRDLFESERNFRLLVEGVADYALYMLDPTGTITSWNIGAQRIKGLSITRALLHAAANAFLDGLAECRRGRGRSGHCGERLRAGRRPMMARPGPRRGAR